MTANVLASNRNAEKLLEIVRTFDPDILVTLESNAWWQERLDILEETYPFTIKCPMENLYGMHVYSRFVLQNTRIEYLVAPNIPSMHALVALPSGDQVCVHFLHPEPPLPQYRNDSSERDAELVMVAKSVVKTDTPTIVTRRMGIRTCQEIGQERYALKMLRGDTIHMPKSVDPRRQAEELLRIQER